MLTFSLQEAIFFPNFAADMKEEVKATNFNLTESKFNEQVADAQATGQVTQLASANMLSSNMNNGISQEQGARELNKAVMSQQASTTGKSDDSTTGSCHVQHETNVEELNQNSLNSIKKRLIESGASTEQYTCTTLKNLRKVGFHLAYSKGNRSVNKHHITELTRALGDNLMFTNFALACPAKVALSLGVELYDETGALLTTDKPSIDMYLLVLDGQHRIIVSIEKNKDIKVLIVPCSKDPNKMIYEINRTNRNWAVSDLRKLIAYSEKAIDELQQATEQAKNILPGCSEKFYAYVLTGKPDAIRKSEVDRGKLPKYDSEEGEIGMDILSGLAFLNSKKAKNVSTLKSIFNVKTDLSKNSTGTEFGQAFKIVLSQATEPELEELNRLLDKTAYTEFESSIHTKLNAFLFNQKIEQKILSESNKKVKQRCSLLVEKYSKTHKIQYVPAYELVNERKKKETSVESALKGKEKSDAI